MNDLIEKIKRKYYADTHDRRTVERNFYRIVYLAHAVILAPLLLFVAIILDKIISVPFNILVIVSFITALVISDHMAKKRSHEKFEMADEE